MILKRIKVQTPFNEFTNCYIVEDEISRETIVIDPGGEINKIMDMLKTLKSKVKYIYLTHCHGDHIGGVNELVNNTKAQILIHRDDSDGLSDDKISLASYIGFGEIIIKDFCRVDDNDLIHIGNLQFKVIHTPGHTKGGSSLYCEQEKMVFTGDTMFRGTWGRTDLPTGSMEQIMNSITNKLLKLPEDTIVYPGHGKSTMIKEEKPIYEELKPRAD
ncbi:MAG: MBL fold metallo-hydrolase [Clostridia bacterium]|nr:MBL fold metallo-hydrolase [Clostridia bacterium]